jgi:multidrug efflux pump subunit AcrA (membrane-fusion protein)
MATIDSGAAATTGMEVDWDAGFDAIVVNSHASTDDFQLNLKIGDKIRVLEEDDSGWAGGYKHNQKDVTGWFPRVCVRPCPQNGSCSRQEQPPSDVPKEETASNLCKEAGALATHQASPIRQMCLVATPQAAAGPSCMATREVNKHKEQSLQAAMDFAIATKELDAERTLRQSLENDFQQQKLLWERQVQDLQEELCLIRNRVALEGAAKQAEIDALNAELITSNAQLSQKEEQRLCLERELDVSRAELRRRDQAETSRKKAHEEEEKLRLVQIGQVVETGQCPVQPAPTPKRSVGLLSSTSASIDRSSPAPAPRPFYSVAEARGGATSPKSGLRSPPKAPGAFFSVVDARGGNTSQPEAAPCPGSVLAQVRAFERRSSSHTRAPAPRKFSREITPRRSDSWISREAKVTGEVQAVSDKVAPAQVNDEPSGTPVSMGLSPMAKGTPGSQNASLAK